MKIDQLTFTRFLAAVSIVIFHYGKEVPAFNNNSVDFIFRNAHICVSYFFILSGFVMMVAYGNKAVIEPRCYFRNRLARIYPLYFLAIIIMFVLQVRTKSLEISGLVLNVFMIQSWIPDKVLSINPSGWSLSVEIIFYAIFPFVFNKIFNKNTFQKSLLYIVLFWFFSQVLFQILLLLFGGDEFRFIKNILLYNPLSHLNEFLIGNLAGFLFIKKWQNNKANYDLLILVFVGLIFLVLKYPLNLNIRNGLLAIFFVPLIIFISQNNGFITKLFQKNILVFLGEISFGIYILQHPIYSLFSAYSVNKYFHINDLTIVFFLRLIILITVSCIAYIYIEKPIQERIKTKNKVTFLESNLANKYKI